MKDKTKKAENTPGMPPVTLNEIVTPYVFLDRLTDFLGSSEGQTTEEVKAELREQGIDIDSFLSEAKAKIKEILTRNGNPRIGKHKRKRARTPEEDEQLRTIIVADFW